MSFQAPRNLVAAGGVAAVSSRPLPVGAVRLHGGILGDRQALNRAVSLGHGLAQLEAAGNLQNFRTIVQHDGRHAHEDALDGDTKNFVDSDVYKWLEAVGWESVRGPLDADVEAGAEAAIGLILAAQDDDGYLNTWYQTQTRAARFSNLPYGHEMYCLGHLIQAGVAFARTRGDDRLLQAGRRFADLILSRFGPEGQVAVCGHPEIEMALVELSRETGDPRYAEQARVFIDRRGHGLLGQGRFGAAYFQDRVPFRELDDVEGHAVRAVYLGAGAVDCAVELGDDGLLSAARRQWSAMRATKTYLTGGVGSRHLGEAFGEAFELPPDGAYCETCAAIGVAMWSWRLLLADRDRDVVDLLERALYNGVLAGVSADGRAFNYVNPLHVRSRHERQPWFEIACCPPNVMRTLASVEHYVASEDDEGVWLHLYTPAYVDGGRGRRLTVGGDYPVNGGVQIRVEAGGREPWTLGLRVPAWADGQVTVEVNGRASSAEADGTGYLIVRRNWSAGDVVSLNLPMTPRLTAADGAIDAIRGTVAVERGPIVYCLESRDAADALDDVVVGPEPRVRVDPVAPGVLPTIRLDTYIAAHGHRDWPYVPLHGTPGRGAVGSKVSVALNPYSAWGNAYAGPMRVWLRAT